MKSVFRAIYEQEQQKNYLFVAYAVNTNNVLPPCAVINTGAPGQIAVDVLDYGTEDKVDGGWFDTPADAVEFINSFKD